MNNVIRFPNQNGQGAGGNQTQYNPMQALMSQLMSGASPMTILNRMGGPQADQARKLISGKNQDQLRQIAMNMAAQRGVDLNALAKQMGINLPK